MKTPKVKTPSALRLTSLGAMLALGAIGIAGCGSSSTGGSSAGAGGGGSLASVGADSIQRGEFVSALEAAHGSEVLMQLIDYHLLLEKAKADGHEVSDADVDAALAERQAKNPQLAAAVASGGPQVDTLKRNIRMELASQKVLTADIKPTDADLKKFFDKYAPVWYDEKASVKVAALMSSTQTRAELMAQQLAKKSKTFVQLVEEQSKANDPVARLSTATPGQPDPLDSFPLPIQAQLKTLPIGGTTKVFTVRLPGNQKGFAVFRLEERINAKKADLTKLKPTVETDYKLAQVAMKVVAENKSNPPFDKALINTANAYFGPQAGTPAPALRDVLQYINQYATGQLLARLRQSGEVSIEDPNYMTLSNAYKAGGAAGAPGAAPAGAAPEGAAPAAPAGAGH